jgi:hypothetical protein
VCAAVHAHGGDEEDFTPLFNGQNLEGWVNVNCAESTWSVRDGMIVCTGVPTGVMRTDLQYENFVLELEYRHLHAGGNAGLFIWSDPVTARGVPFTRSIEVQVLDGVNTENYTSHGDIFAIHGAELTPDRPHPAGWARCLPSERRAKPAPEWNHYRVTCQDGAVKLAVNGEEVSGGYACRPRKGYICLESEGSEVHFRDLRIRELPSSNPPPEETADLADGFVALYNGLDLTGWKQADGHVGHWKPNNWTLAYDGASEAEEKDLWTERSYRNFVLIADWRFTREPSTKTVPVVLPNGDYELDAAGERKMAEVADAGDSGIYLRGSSKSQVNMWCWPVGSGEVYGYRTDEEQLPEVRAGVTPKIRADEPPGSWNRFVITLVGDRLTVVLNGQTVIEQAQLPGIAEEGPIALQHHGDPIEFANLYIKELP